MAVFYRLTQETRRNNKNNGKWFARAVVLNTIDTEGLITEIEKICTATDADVAAVVKALIFVMNKQLQAGNRVKLDGFGSFKIGLKTKCAETAKDFSAATNVVGSRVNFQPETHWSSADGNTRRRQFLTGLKVAELPKNGVVKDDESNDESSTGGDSQENG